AGRAHRRRRGAQRRRAGHPPAPQDRSGPARAGLPAHRARRRLSAGGAHAASSGRRGGRLMAGARRFSLRRILPKGLYARTMIMVIAPIAIMQVVVVRTFFEGHWETVTARLTDAAAGDVAYLARAYDADPEGFPAVSDAFFDTADMSAEFAPGEALPDSLRPA